MTYTFSGPSFLGLIPGMAIAAGVGKLYQSVANTNTSPVYILAMRQFADYVIYKWATGLFSPWTARSVVYTVTNLMVNCATLGVLLQQELIGIIGTAVFVSIMACEFFCKVHDLPKYISY